MRLEAQCVIVAPRLDADTDNEGRIFAHVSVVGLAGFDRRNFAVGDSPMSR
jgi:hypothetical protein